MPDAQTDDTAPAQPADENFGLPLEEELEALASEASGPVDSQSDAVEPLGAADDRAERPEEPAARSLRETVDQDEVVDDFAADLGDRPPEDDGFDLDEEDLAVPEYYSAEEQEQGRSRGRGVAAALVVLGVAVAGGAGFYFWNSSLGSNSGNAEPPVIAADNEPVKVKPEDPGGTTVPNQDLAVYDRVSGTDAADPQEQNLVTTAEEPVDVVQRTLAPEALPLEGRNDTGEPLVKSEERLVASGGNDNSSTTTAEPGSEAAAIPPRKVRTLVVKPDGTIVARDLPETPRVVDLSGQQQASDTASGSGQADSAAPTETVALAPAQTTSPVQNPEPSSDGEASGQADTQAPSDTATETTATEDTSADSVPAVGTQSSLPPIDDNLRDNGETPVPADKPATASQPEQVNTTQAPASSNTPVPATRPAEQPVNVVEAVNERGNLAGRETTGQFDGYSMQISSQPSEAGARQSYDDLSRRYASIIGGLDYSIRRANIPEKGIFYRVRIPVGSRADATALCNRYKAAGGNCFVAR